MTENEFSKQALIQAENLDLKGRLESALKENLQLNEDIDYLRGKVNDLFKDAEYSKNEITRLKKHVVSLYIEK